MFSRRPAPQMNRGRVPAVVAASGGPPPYVAPTVPVPGKVGYFLIGDDIVDASTWAPRADIFGQGNPVITNGALNASGWVTPEGNRKTITLNGTSAYLQLNALASMLAGDDSPFEYVIWYKKNATTNPSNTIAAGSSTSSATPRKILSFAAGAYVFTHQSTPNNFAHNANNTLQQMVRVLVTNNGAGTNTTLWRNEDLDPVDADGTLQANVGTQAINTWTIGVHNNGGSLVNWLNAEIFAVWVRDPAAAPLTEAEGVELHNFVMGGYATAPLYTGATVYYLPVMVGQSNSPLQGIATGAVAGMPDADVKTYWRNLNNDADDPIAYRALDVRPGANAYSGSAQHMPTGTFDIPHHMCGVGRGATNAGSDWGGGAGAGPTNSLQGYYSTNLYSECRRNIMMSKARFGGAPIVQIIWQQGENDAAAGAVVAGQYGLNWGAIKAYLRALVLRTWGVSDAFVHAVQLNPNQTGGGIVLADLNTIRAAMVTDDSGDANESLIETNDITALQVDNLHYNAAGYATIASRLVTSIKASNGAL